MTTLTKDKTLTDYQPEVFASAGVPASPAIPRRTITSLALTKIEVPHTAMEVFYRKLNISTGQYSYSSTRPPGDNVDVFIHSPLVKLRETLGRPNLTAAQAHYREVLALVDFDTLGRNPLETLYRVPVEWSSAWIEELRWVTNTFPPVPAVAAIPAVPGTPAIYTYDDHLGWNAGARSLKVIDTDTPYLVKFTVGNNIGAVVGISRLSSVQGSTRRNGFGHILTGVAIGDGVVRLIRNGAFVRDGLGNDVVVAVDGAEAFEVHMSNGTCRWSHGETGDFARERVQSGVDYVLDAVMYSGGDYVDAASITESPNIPGEMEFNLEMGALTINTSMVEAAVAELTLAPMRMRASDAIGWSDITAYMPPMRLTASTVNAGRGNLVMRALYAAMGPIALGLMDARMPRMTLEAEVSASWVPTYSMAQPVLHPLTMSAVLLVGGLIDADLQMPALWMRASEKIHGEAVLGMESLILNGQITTGRGPINMTERILPFNSITENLYITVVLTERVRGKDSAAPQLLAVASMLEELDARDVASATQRALAFLLEQIGALGPTRALTFRVDGDGWTLVDDSEGWAVNTETGGSSRYTGFGYDSFATVNGRHLGVRANGVYLLEGDTDAGQPIHAGVHLGLQDFGTSQLKSLSNVYLGVSATGGLFIKVGVGEGEAKLEYTYAARRVDAHLATQRFDLGRGLRSNYFSFELVNDGEADFELERIEFVAVASSRRI